MKEPNWLSKDTILAIHSAAIARFGGSDGIRDEALVDSALNRPLQLFHYENPDLFELAAIYASGIVKSHPFLDGNKRTGFLALYTFLGINGLRLIASEEVAALQIIALADCRLNDQELADWISKSCEPR
ncbi:type II toxin-antitoxin system death-on-curing family toxin [Coraliomargarita sp. SDUM461004]|uniref:Type II toxin-antitoxin system death-on-curing family toxin n=1 Tax=Thalassobacterium sedimentorum TaxID=3041258 RepID=A0ABU1AQP2_9BACT|nr:type II toxin-antitoxin system death-on-curing family toxin [Coraliomargarita sp. SDUM461004]MDQ8196086.1 type II toxin-antitoxin system death-on-curing family toxin [Coraliomargarita sp. SDUM461004]